MYGPILKKEDRRVAASWAAFAAAVTVLLLHAAFMALSGKYPWSKNDYNSYLLQSCAWLEGRLDLGRDYPWLELAVFKGKYFVSFPPFPSYLLLPFAAVFGEGAPDGFLALASTLLGAVYAVRIAERLGLSPWYASFLSVFLYTGTAVWQITADAWVWFLAQNLSVTLTLMALFSALCGQTGRTLFFLCAAVGCRPFQLLWLPFAVLLLRAGRPALPSGGKERLRFFLRLLPAALLAGSFLLLNFARFGNPLQFGHDYLPEFTRPGNRQFALRHLAENLPSLFRLPEWDAAAGRFKIPRFQGMNLFLAFPILLWALALQLRAVPALRMRENRAARAAAVCALCTAALHVLLLLTHRTMGGYHYGNRYIADTLPGVFAALCVSSRLSGFERGGRPAPGWPLALGILYALGLALSLYGVLSQYRQA